MDDICLVEQTRSIGIRLETTAMMYDYYGMISHSPLGSKNVRHSGAGPHC